MRSSVFFLGCFAEFLCLIILQAGKQVRGKKAAEFTGWTEEGFNLSHLHTTICKPSSVSFQVFREQFA